MVVMATISSVDRCVYRDIFPPLGMHTHTHTHTETATKTGMIILLGEISSKSLLDYQRIVRETVKEIGEYVWMCVCMCGCVPANGVSVM